MLGELRFPQLDGIQANRQQLEPRGLPHILELGKALRYASCLHY